MKHTMMLALGLAAMAAMTVQAEKEAAAKEQGYQLTLDVPD
jgi:hypothetical protein